MFTSDENGPRTYELIDLTEPDGTEDGLLIEEGEL